MKNTIDLHTHTTKSDGTYTPNELLQEAQKLGLNLLSITDHESVDAYFDMDRTLFSGKIIPGIELRTSCLGVAIELLGYGFDINKMKDTLQNFHYMNTREFDSYMVSLAYEQYLKRGLKLDSDFKEKYNPIEHPRFSKYLLASIQKHPENNKFLKDLPEGKSFFRVCMTNPNSPLFLDLSTAFPNISELITAIKSAGGMVSIPHIFEYKENAKKILENLLENYDIDIVECYYSSFTKEQTDYLLDICSKYNKYISGGSDFHGDLRPDVHLGRGKENNLYIPQSTVEKWTDKINNFETI